jgi:hypothetical protein
VSRLQDHERRWFYRDFDVARNDVNMRALMGSAFSVRFSEGPRPYGFAVGRGVKVGEVAGVVVPAGNAPAPESGAAEAPGEL